MHRMASALVLVLAALPFSGYAQVSDLEADVFALQSTQIRQDLQTEKYSEITSADRARVLSLLDRIESNIGGVSNITKLSENAKVAVFNDQEQVNTILTGAAADSREVCRREIVVGSNRRVSTCLTVAERRRRAVRAQEELGDMQRMPMTESR